MFTSLTAAILGTRGYVPNHIERELPSGAARLTAYQRALATWRRLNGLDPHPDSNLQAFLRYYSRTPTKEELDARRDMLAERLAALKARCARRQWWQ